MFEEDQMQYRQDNIIASWKMTTGLCMHSRGKAHFNLYANVMQDSCESCMFHC